MQYINVSSKDGFLHLKELPKNCIFNKKVTGCGGTTIAMQDKDNYIIACPTVELIINKLGITEAGKAEKFGNLCYGLFGAFTREVKKDFKNFLKENPTKILCTYDKLERIIPLIDTKKWNLLVDEYHLLLKQYSFRDKAINGVLQHFKDFKSFCFMSATPIMEDFKPDVLKDVEEVEAVWENTDILKVILEKTNKPYLKVANIIKAYKQDGYITMNGFKSYEAFFFINSVTDIANILNHCNLSNDEVKIVCKDDENNRKKLKGYTISNSLSDNKPFTFITCKSFEGADYFSKTGVCFVVSNTYKKSTLLDIKTDIYQIAGRIRTKDNPFRNILIHIYNSNKGDIEPLEAAKQRITDSIKENASIIDYVNHNNIKNPKLDADYFYKEGDIWKVNNMLYKLELYSAYIDDYIYNRGLPIAYNENGVLTSKVNYEKIEETMKQIVVKPSFKKQFLAFLEDPFTEVDELVLRAYKELGADKVRSLRYSKKAVLEALKKPVIDNDLKILSKPGFYTLKEVKEITGVPASKFASKYNLTIISKKINNKTIEVIQIK